ncbi:MAG: hypothetical protein D6762_00050, partial [Candidatus Neomarinimicrobiota bacterium]
MDLTNRQELETYFARHMDTVLFPVLADQYLQSGDLERALKVCEIGLEYHPQHVDGLYLQARVLKEMGRLDEAEKCLLSLQSAGQYHARGMELLVEVQRKLHRSPAARLQVWKYIHQHCPTHPRAAANIRRLKRQLAAGPGPKPKKRVTSSRWKQNIPESFTPSAVSTSVAPGSEPASPPPEEESPPSFQATRSAEEIELPEDILGVEASPAETSPAPEEEAPGESVLRFREEDTSDQEESEPPAPEGKTEAPELRLQEDTTPEP